MKKLLSIALALVLILSMSIVASAEGETATWEDMSTITLTKEYKLANAGTSSPAETFTFSTLTCTGVAEAGVGTDGAVVTTSNAPVPTIGSVSYEAGEAGGDNAKKTITIDLPKYTAVGIYTYTFSETDNGTAGVTYRSEAIKLVVTVIEQNGKVRVAQVHTEGENDTAKSTQFDNTYSAGSLAITKAVTGIMGDKQKEFTVKVTFTAPAGETVKSVISYTDGDDENTIAANWTGSQEVNITLKDTETVTFTNIPYGVTYTVVEDDYTGADGYDAATYTYTDETKDEGGNLVLNKESETVTITNNKNGTVDTGITMDSMPYVLLMAVACFGMVVLFSKKRMMREN